MILKKFAPKNIFAEIVAGKWAYILPQIDTFLTYEGSNDVFMSLDSIIFYEEDFKDKNAIAYCIGVFVDTDGGVELKIPAGFSSFGCVLEIDRELKSDLTNPEQFMTVNGIELKESSQGDALRPWLGEEKVVPIKETFGTLSINDLNQLLQSYIDDSEFEMAAKVRDEITSRKSNSSDKSVA